MIEAEALAAVGEAVVAVVTGDGPAVRDRKKLIGLQLIELIMKDTPAD